jgi:hypothetical protein
MLFDRTPDYQGGSGPEQTRQRTCEVCATPLFAARRSLAITGDAIVISDANAVLGAPAAPQRSVSVPPPRRVAERPWSRLTGSGGRFCLDN